MARKPRTWHAQALAEMLKGRITRDEYKAIIRGRAWISGGTIWECPDEDFSFTFTRRRLADTPPPSRR